MKAKKIKIILIISITTLFLCECTDKVSMESVAIVPYPKSIVANGGSVSFDISKAGVTADAATVALCPVVIDDLFRLSGIKASGKTNPVISLSVDKTLGEEAYRIKTSKEKIDIAGGSYKSVSMGWTSVLQAVEISKGRLTLPAMEINDSPDLEYRGLLLDLARQFHSHHVVKQVIDMCRWYKINYLQLHISDDSRIVVPTEKFPALLREGNYYTREQLREIVEYAEVRGVTLVPELEGPGHSTILRANYPDLFGPTNYSVIDLSSEKAIESMKILAEEVMEFFPYSDYFHIGADEANLSILEKVPHVVKKIKEKGYSNVHDLYLNYIVEMNEFIKSKGKQTLVWEGFDKDGSEHVKIPKDIVVFVFETLYQRPDSLVANGYRILNTSWKPIYIVPTRRWSPEKIYSWNYATWENFWEITPAYKKPIVLNEKERENVWGTMMCAWEMPEEMEYPALCKRLAAMGERVWNASPVCDFPQFEGWMNRSEAKLRRLIYPFEIKADGLTQADYQGVYYNRENYFSEQLTLSIKSWIPNTVLKYSNDRSFPSIDAATLPEKMTLNNTTFLKIALYDSNGILLSYLPVLYENRPLKITFKGEDFYDNNTDGQISFEDQLLVNIEMVPASGSVHYTLDGSEPTIDSPMYNTEISVNKACSFRAKYFDEKGNVVGQSYSYYLYPRKKVEN